MALSTAQTWVDHESWPFGPKPWKPAVVEKIPAWKKANLREDRARETAVSGRDPRVAMVKQQAEAQLAVERAGYTKAKRKALEGELHDVATCQAEQTERAHKLKLQLITYLPSECVRMEEERFRQAGRPLTTLEKQDIIRTKVEEALRALSGE